VPAVAAGRTNPNVPSHRLRRPFFSPAYETDEPRVRVTKDPVDPLQGTKTREPICIRQTTGFACFRHPSIMPKFSTLASRILCRKNGHFTTAMTPFLPTRNHEEPYI
jgi:hypothetical protein